MVYICHISFLFSSATDQSPTILVSLLNHFFHIRLPPLNFYRYEEKPAGGK